MKPALRKVFLITASAVILCLMSAQGFPQKLDKAPVEKKVNRLKAIDGRQLLLKFKDYATSGADSITVRTETVGDIRDGNGTIVIPSGTTVDLKTRPIKARTGVRFGAISFEVQPILLKDGTRVIVSAVPVILHASSGEIFHPLGKGEQKYFRAALFPVKLVEFPAEVEAKKVVDAKTKTLIESAGPSSALIEIASVVIKMMLSKREITLLPDTVLSVALYNVTTIQPVNIAQQPADKAQENQPSPKGASNE